MNRLRLTAIERLEHVSRATGAEVWIKREDLSHPEHGGNKVRKLVPILADAVARGATELVTLGAAGSNHVLATCVHGRALGLDVHAALVPHPRSVRAEHQLRCIQERATRLFATGSEPEAAARIGALWLDLRMRGRRPYLIPPGGTDALGTRGMVETGRETLRQFQDLGLTFERIICVLGSGGTAAGLAAALAEAASPTVLHAVRVYPSRVLGRTYLGRLARGAVSSSVSSMKPLVIDERQLGAGYGNPTEAADHAASLFAKDGIELEPTYTGKAAAALIAHASVHPGARLLFWHSLSAATPNATGALRPEIDRLLE